MKKQIKKLTKKELVKLQKNYPEWKLDAKETKMTRTFDFEKHIDALIFIARATVNAEVVQHHPDITFTHKKVKVVSTTHEIKGLTKRDDALLARVDKVYAGQMVDKK